MKPSAFNVDENACIQTLLNLVSHGNAVIAEILRLKDNIPPAFTQDTKEDQIKYADIIFDLTYFKNPDVHEKKITNSLALQEFDDEFKEKNLSIISRFYLALESIYQYGCDLNLFLEQLDDGHFIQQTLDTVLQDSEGKQLCCESLYLYGCMLLVCETHMPGRVRERLFVAYHRSVTSHHQTDLDRVCHLLQDTGHSGAPGGRRPNNYPHQLFSRLKINETFIDIVIGRLRSEDIYNQMSVYPLPEHRSTALATQAAMLVVCLFFSPNMLISESAKMREIVDKYFPDNWVISIYMGITLNLIETWETYKAAKSALANTINTKNVKELSQKHAEQMQKMTVKTEKLLQEGALKEEKLSDNVNSVLNLIRECNVTLRWLMLHTSSPVIHYDNVKRSRQVRDQIISDAKYSATDLFQLLVNTSLMELNIKEMLKNLLNNKELKWEAQKKDAKERIIELSEVFSGEKPLPRVTKNENLHKWFEAIARRIDSLKRDDITLATKKIIQLIQALEDVQEFHQLDDIMQVKQWLAEARNELKLMVRGGGLTEDSLVTLQICSDLSYAWYVAKTFTDLGREALKKDPAVVSHLRALFLKLASALEIPLMRINQAESPDLLSVSQYYSNQLVAYVREVLQVIPETVFSLLARIIHLQTSVIKELPTRLEKDKLKDFAQLDHRMEVAKLTHSVSVFTSGILKMRSTLVGVICIDPKELLEDGIRREVSRLMNSQLSQALVSSKSPEASLSQRLQHLAVHMDGYQRSFEYIQDYINIHGLKIWQEEVSKIIDTNVDEECDRLMKLKPNQLPASTSEQKNMFHCLIQDIYNLTDPRSTVYIENNSAWFDKKNHNETMSMSLISQIQKAVGPAGLRGVSRVLGHRAAARLRHLSQLLPTLVQNQPRPAFPSPDEPIPNAGKFYSQLLGKFASKPAMQAVDWIIEVGALQILMRHVAYQLNLSCKFNSYHLEATLSAINDAVILDVKTNYTDTSKPYPHREYLVELNELLQRAGLNDPYTTVYIKTKHSQAAYIMFLVTIAHLPRLAYYENLGCLAAKKSSDPIDGAPFIVGIATLLRQYNAETLNQYMLLVCQYVISYADMGLSQKNPEFPPESTMGLRFLDVLCRATKTPQSLIETVIPMNIITQYQFMSIKT